VSWAGFSPSLSDVIGRIWAALPTGANVYLVGGSVRDVILGRSTNDLDFVYAGDSLALARRIGNAIGAAYFPLDLERQTARLILLQPDGSRLKLDFAAMRGADLESDLRARDFTINAMALALNDSANLIDPLGGLSDLRAKILRTCTAGAIQDDPVRVVRAVRLATSLSCKIVPETRQQIRQATQYLDGVSPERLRDELFKILEGRQPAIAIRLLDRLDALAYILPELILLKGVRQSPPHIYDVWEHSLKLVQRLEQILDVLASDYDQEKAASWALGLISVQLGRFRQPLGEHMENRLNPERSLRSLLFLSGLYHDSGKPMTRRIDESDRTRFFEHEIVSATLATDRARQLHLSNNEIEYLAAIVRNHLRPILLAQTGTPPTRRAIYRYFRAAKAAGIDIGLLSLADSLATYGPSLPSETWAQQVGVIRDLYESWWENPEKSVQPPQLVNGSDLIESFKLNPGPKIGQILEAIREAQATGQVETREQALNLAKKLIEVRSIDGR